MQMICPLSLKVKKSMHVSMYQWLRIVPYHGDEYKDLDGYPKCGAPRYMHAMPNDGSKTIGGAIKLTWYFPIFSCVRGEVVCKCKVSQAGVVACGRYELFLIRCNYLNRRHLNMSASKNQFKETDVLRRPPLLTYRWFS
jgi:hypothetical protein